MKKSSRVAVTTLTLVTFLAPFLQAGTSSASQAGGTTPKEWKGRFSEGSVPLKEGTSLKISVRQDEVFFHTKKKGDYSAPLSEISGVLYDNVSHSRAIQSLKSSPLLWSGAGHGSESSLLAFHPLTGLLVYGILTATMFAVLVPFSSQDHFVHIVWVEDNEPHLLVAEMGKKDYRPFLEDLQTATGKGWTNLPAEREWLKTAIQQEKTNKVDLQLTRSARFQSRVLQPGPYQMVLLNRDQDLTLACLFSGPKVKLDRLALTAPVRVTEGTDSVEAPVVSYRDNGWKAELERIQVGTRTLDFPVHQGTPTNP